MPLAHPGSRWSCYPQLPQEKFFADCGNFPYVPNIHTLMSGKP
jgi:hypothetical protein